MPKPRFPSLRRRIKPFEGVQVVRVTFPSPVVTPYPVNNLVTGFLFQPSTPGPHPVMLVEHEWLPNTLDNESRMSASLARAGIAAFLIVQPYSYNRRLVPRVPDVETDLRGRAADGRCIASGRAGQPARAGLA